MIHIYVTGVIEDKNTNPKQDETVWESDETYIQWENEFEIPILKKEAEQEEEKKRKKLLAEDQAKQLANMPRLNLFEDAKAEDVEDEETEPEDVEDFEYEMTYLGLSPDSKFNL